MSRDKCRGYKLKRFACFVYSFTGVAHSARLDLSAVCVLLQAVNSVHTLVLPVYYFIYNLSVSYGFTTTMENGKSLGCSYSPTQTELWQLSCNFSKSSPGIVFEASWRFKAFLSRWSHTDSMILRSGPGQSITDDVLLCVFYLDMLLLHW